MSDYAKEQYSGDLSSSEKEPTKFEQLEKRFEGVITDLTNYSCTIRKKVDLLYSTDIGLKGVSGKECASIPTAIGIIEKLHVICNKLEDIGISLKDSCQSFSKIV